MGGARCRAPVPDDAGGAGRTGDLSRGVANRRDGCARLARGCPRLVLDRGGLENAARTRARELCDRLVSAPPASVERPGGAGSRRADRGIPRLPGESRFLHWRRSHDQSRGGIPRDSRGPDRRCRHRRDDSRGAVVWRPHRAAESGVVESDAGVARRRRARARQLVSGAAARRGTAPRRASTSRRLARSAAPSRRARKSRVRTPSSVCAWRNFGTWTVRRPSSRVRAHWIPSWPRPRTASRPCRSCAAISRPRGCGISTRSRSIRSTSRRGAGWPRRKQRQLTAALLTCPSSSSSPTAPSLPDRARPSSAAPAA